MAGTAHATSFPTSSDLRFKDDIQPITGALETVERLKGVRFRWNRLHREVLKRSRTDAAQIGLIAQEVREVVPEVVSTWEDGTDYLAVDYGRLVPLLIEAIKELRAQIHNPQNVPRKANHKRRRYPRTSGSARNRKG